MTSLPSWLRISLAASLAALAACGAGAAVSATCPEKDQICGSDGKFHCRTVPANVTKLQPSCCPAERRLPLPSDGTDGGTPATDGSAVSGDGDGGTTSAASDGGTAARDAGAGPDAAAEPCDAGIAPHDAGATDGPRPLADDAGVKFEFHCGVDFCHPLAGTK